MLLNRIVIGSTVEAAYYAFVNDAYFIPNRKDPPMFYRKLSVPILGFAHEPGAWNRLLLMLGLLGRLVEYEDTIAMRFDRNTLKIAADNTTYRYEFEIAEIFDTTGIDTENKYIATHEPTFTVLDDFEISVLGAHRFSLPSDVSQDDLAKEIHFYTSDRVSGANYVTDCVVESKLNYSQINDFDYSDSIVKIILERHLTSIGICGTFMYNYPSGKPKYRKPKVKHVSRHVFRKDSDILEDTEKVKMKNLTLEEIISEPRTKR